jgi:hypothetical protein
MVPPKGVARPAAAPAAAAPAEDDFQIERF